MATTASKATPVSPTVGQWVHDFYDAAFFQPNLEVSATTMHENLAQGFTSTINHDQISRQEYIEMIKKFYIEHLTVVKSIKEILSWDAPDGAGGGCVAHLVHLTDTKKDTGVSKDIHSLLLANVKVIGGKRMLCSITEVMKTEVLRPSK